MPRLRVAVGADGGGTCFQSVLDNSNFFNFDAVVAYTNVPGCKAMDRARGHGVPAIELNPSDFGRGRTGRRKHELALQEELAKHEFDAIAMLGDERIKTGEFVANYAEQGIPVLNTHPAPAPQFRGLEGYAWALGEDHKDAVRRNEWTCVTFHTIDKHVDRGIIVAQTLVPVYEKDTEDDLKERGLKLEWGQIAHALDYQSRGRLEFNQETQTSEVLDENGKKFSDYIPSLESTLGDGTPGQPGKAWVEVQSRQPSMRVVPQGERVMHLDVTEGIPRNLLFTYAYRQVKDLRQRGVDVTFHFDGINVHPIIMKSDVEKGEKPY